MRAAHRFYVAALFLAGGCASAIADPAVPATLPASAQEDFTHIAITNGLLTAQVYPPGKHELYQGTRFDHAGVVFHVTYKGQEYSNYWYDRFVVDPHDPKKYGAGTQSACCSTSGPVEEYGAIGFDEACPPSSSEAVGQSKKCRFLKIGVGILQKTIDKYDQFPTLPILNAGKRTFKATKTGARWTQDLNDTESGYGYRYAKTVALVPGKPQMTISHVLTNTGSKPIVTTVFCHNFLTLDPGSEHMVITAPFDWHATQPLQPELVKLDGKTIRYLAPIPAGATTQSKMTGFGTAVSDYDFTITDTKSGFGERIRADQPVADINMWSINTTYSLEPYVAISLKPGETKRWTYTYDFFGGNKT